MIFNLFRRKKAKEEPKTYDGEFISDEELAKIISNTKDSYFKREMGEINDMLEDIKKYMCNE